MPLVSFSYTYPWPTIIDELPPMEGTRTHSAGSSVHVGDDEGASLAHGGGVGSVQPLDPVWEDAITTITAMLTVRDRQEEDFFSAWFNVCQLTGTLDGSGNVVVAHGVTTASRRVLWVGAWFRFGAGLAKPLTVQGVDDTNVTCVGGSVGVAYRIIMIFSTNLIDPTTWT